MPTQTVDIQFARCAKCSCCANVSDFAPGWGGGDPPVPEDPDNPKNPPIYGFDPVPKDPPAETSRFSAFAEQSVSQAAPLRPTLEFFPTAEGYYDYVSKRYVYQYKDHLGNVRLSYAKNQFTQVLEIIEENNYYPFGLKHKPYNSDVRYSNAALGYKYNGKELQDELGLNMYDYGARNYDPALGRWMNIDPLAEKSRRFNPYTYALDNPVYFIDPDGMMASSPPDWFVNRDTGAVVQVEGKSSLTQATANKIGAGDAKKYDRLGADNMFGKNNEKANKIRELGASVVENPEIFMEKQGYKMADKVEMVEKNYETKGSFGKDENIAGNVTDGGKPLGDSSITYVKPDELNKKTDVSTTTSKGTLSSIETSTYTLTTPHSQKSSSSAGSTNSMIGESFKIIYTLFTDHMTDTIRSLNNLN